jgi:cytosine/adenosine deaminase-related metal-dependent hydrolase
VLTGISLRHTPDDVYAGTLWGALQALDAGITTIADWAHNDQSPAHADADLRAVAGVVRLPAGRLRASLAGWSSGCFVREMT